jgi:hypothetical protein
VRKENGNSTLIIENATRDSTNGVLLNYGNGRTRFQRIRAINDSQFTVGGDTITIPGISGSGGVRINELLAANGTGYILNTTHPLWWSWTDPSDWALRLGTTTSSSTNNSTVLNITRTGSGGLSSRGISVSNQLAGAGGSTVAGYFNAENGVVASYALETNNGQILFKNLGGSTARFVKANALGVLYPSDTLSATGVPISGLLPAIATNTINNVDYNQEWQWNSLTGDALTLSSTSTAIPTSQESSILEIIRSGANANATANAYGMRVDVTNSGTSSTNVGVRSDVSGATINYGMLGAGTNYGVSGQSTGASGYGIHGYSTGAGSKGGYFITIGTTGSNFGADASATGVGATSNYGGRFSSSGATTNYGSYSLANGTSGTNYGAMGIGNGTGATTNYGGRFEASNAGTNYGVYGLSPLYGVYGRATGGSAGSAAVYAESSSTSGQHYGIYSSVTGNGPTTKYGIYNDVSGTGTNNVAGFFKAIGATNNYAIIIEDGAGSVGIGTNTPHASSLLNVQSTTKGFLPPRMSTTQRDAISSPSEGLMIWDTTVKKMSVYDGTVWKYLMYE